jgi:hypothetical protein
MGRLLALVMIASKQYLWASKRDQEIRSSPQLNHASQSSSKTRLIRWLAVTHRIRTFSRHDFPFETIDQSCKSAMVVPREPSWRVGVETTGDAVWRRGLYFWIVTIANANDVEHKPS